LNKHSKSGSEKRDTADAKKETRDSRRFAVEVITLILVFLYAGFAAWQAWEMKKAVSAANAANRLTMEAVRARIVFGGNRFIHPITAEQHVEVIFPLKNIGRSTAFYGLKAKAFRWTGMPDGDIPIAEPDPATPLEPDSPTRESIADKQVITQDYIDRMPTFTDIATTARMAVEHTNLDSPKPTIYFVGRLVYESVGPEIEKDFCFYLVRTDAYSRSLGTPQADLGDSNFMFMSCPKWNGTYEKKQ
jgi:hypothetical protein